jgi:hypothetical protein
MVFPACAGVNNTYSYNTLFSAPHNCMLGGGNEGDGVDCLFEYNSFDRCGFESSDAGAFYSCGQAGTAFTNRGNVLRHSSFRNVRNAGSAGVQGITLQAIYLDDQLSGWHIYNNTFVNCQTGTFIGGGSFNIVHDNYFELCDTAQHFDNRGMGWEKSSCNGTAPCLTPGNGGTCTCNAAAAYHLLTGPAGAEWHARFGSELSAVLNDTKCANENGALPCYSQVINNRYCNVTRFIDASQQDTDSWNAVVANNTQHCA